MNHLPCSESHRWQHIRVVYLGQEEYDGLGFVDYPVRKGFQDANDKTINLSRRSLSDQSAFLQTWLSFGLLTEVLEISVDMQDFVKDGLVTTKQLPDYISQWYDRVVKMTDAARQESHLKAQQCLMRVRVHCLTLIDEAKQNAR